MEYIERRQQAVGDVELRVGAQVRHARAYDHGYNLGEDGDNLDYVQYVREEGPLVGAHDRPDHVLDQTDLHRAEMQVRLFERRQLQVARVVVVQALVFGRDSQPVAVVEYDDKYRQDEELPAARRHVLLVDLPVLQLAPHDLIN